MNKSYPFGELKNLLDQSQALEIFLPVNPKFDQVAAALALKLALTKKGKPASVLSASPMIVEFSHLVGVDTIGEKVGNGRDLVISFNYPLDQIEKVSYNDEGGRLNLVVQSKEGVPKIEKDQLIFSYQGGEKGLQVTVGVDNPSRLGQLGNQLDFNRTVNVDNSPNNSHYGKINVVDADSSSCSEMAVALISGLGLPVDQDVANNLYLGLKESTGNFTTGNVGADTFEAASLCLRWGAKGPTGAVIQKPVFGKTQIQPKSRQPQPGKFMGGSPKPPPQDNSAPSPDWLEPKIFKSSNIS
jgi:hypothetical protein